MKRPYLQSSSFNAAGLAIGSILALIVAMAISIAFDLQPAEARNGTACWLQSLKRPRQFFALGRAGFKLQGMQDPTLVRLLTWSRQAEIRKRLTESTQ